MNKAFFLDRDGTIIVDKHYLSNPNEVELLVGAAKAIRLMNEAGYKVIVVSNQSGVARGMFTMKDVDKVNQRLNQLLDMENAHIDAFYICPHHPDGIISRTIFNANVENQKHICLKKQQKIIKLI